MPTRNPTTASAWTSIVALAAIAVVLAFFLPAGLEANGGREGKAAPGHRGAPGGQAGQRQGPPFSHGGHRNQHGRGHQIGRGRGHDGDHGGNAESPASPRPSAPDRPAAPTPGTGGQPPAPRAPDDKPTEPPPPPPEAAEPEPDPAPSPAQPPDSTPPPASQPSNAPQPPATPPADHVGIPGPIVTPPSPAVTPPSRTVAPRSRQRPRSRQPGRRTTERPPADRAPAAPGAGMPPGSGSDFTTPGTLRALSTFSAAASSVTDARAREAARVPRSSSGNRQDADGSRPQPGSLAAPTEPSRTGRDRPFDPRSGIALSRPDSDGHLVGVDPLILVVFGIGCIAGALLLAPRRRRSG